MCLPQHISKAGKPRSRGFGFVTFENEGSALSATRQKFLHVLGKQVKCGVSVFTRITLGWCSS